MLEVTSGDPDLNALAMGPNDSVVMYQGYDINAYTLYTRKQDKKSANQNSDVQWVLVPRTNPLTEHLLWNHRRNMGARIWRI